MKPSRFGCLPNGDVVLTSKNTFDRIRRGLRKWSAAAAAVAAGAVLNGCGTSQVTGIYALPVAPQTTPNISASPQVGPTNVPDRECKQSSGDYRLGAGDRIRVVVLSDTEFSADYEVNATGAISARMIGNVDVTGKTTNELEQILREQVLLQIPMQRVCKPDCQGICPVCGANRNETACRCEVHPTDDRWSALKKVHIV